MSAASHQHVFISHASADDDFVRELRVKLELSGVKLWVDSRNLAGGNKLEPEIEQAILASSHVIAVLSPRTINSPWVRKEIQFAEANDHNVIPLLLPGIEPAALGMWFDEEPVGVPVELDPGKLDEAMAGILAALGKRLPDDPVSDIEVVNQPVAELLLKLSRPDLVKQEDGSDQLSAEAELEFIPVASATMRTVSSTPFLFTAPIGQIEQDELRWYLEQYIQWPVGLFRERAERLEAQLPQWGDALFAELHTKDECRTVLEAWQTVRANVERRFSLRMDTRLMQSASAETKAKVNEAASRLQALPWELLRHDGAYLCASANPVHIRRRLPNLKSYEAGLLQLPIRILLVSARPEQEGVGYIDHRASALPLVDAVEALGDLVQLTVLTPATLPALSKALKHAQAIGQPYHVLHFDGHGIYDPQHGLGALCFEDANDRHKLRDRRMALVHADKLAELLRDYRIPLVFLEACQTAQTATDPNASVAAKLLEEGVTSVVAMTHSVLVKTAERFVTAFYKALALGKRVGAAMLAGQEDLRLNSYRLAIPGAGDLHLQDWFVPILYQEQNDPALFERLPSERAQRMTAQQRQALLGALPETPEHSFIGRSRELLALERLLERQPYAVIRGQGGIGKTTIAVELARWLVRSRRFDRCAFVSVEEHSHDRAVLDVLGKQLVGDAYSVAEYGGDLDRALQPLLRELENFRCLIVVDNLESLLGDESKANLAGIFAVLEKLLTPSPQPLSLTGRGALSGGTAKLPSTSGRGSGGEGASLLFTTREPLPEPFNHNAREITLGALSQTDAKALVLQVMNNQGLDLRHDDLGNDPAEVNALVDAVGGHARALVLLARELAIKGVVATTENVREVMQDLHRRHPGERELSLFASVELSLRRLSPEVRGQIDGLAVFNAGGVIRAFEIVLEIDRKAVKTLLQELTDVGLVSAVCYDYYRFDPSLSCYLGLLIDEDKRGHFKRRWLAAIESLFFYLYDNLSGDSGLSYTLLRLELPNILPMFDESINDFKQGKCDSDLVSGKLFQLEQLLMNLNIQGVLDKVRKWQKLVCDLSGEPNYYGHSEFYADHVKIERLFHEGSVEEALIRSKALVLRLDNSDYQNKDRDLAVAYLFLGRSFRSVSQAELGRANVKKAIDLFEKQESLDLRVRP